MVLAITMLGCFSPPRTNNVTREVVPHIQSASGEIHPSAVSVASSTDSLRGFTFHQARSIWQKVGLRLPAASSPIARGSGVAAVLVLAGMSLGVLRLVVGLCAVGECRRRGKRIDDPGLLTLVHAVKAALGCDRTIELRELPALDSPATAGWLRPMVLLPSDWRSWG
jgi:beta-lactamase regulating signal transducer with metallopeptidase domain